MMNQKYPNEHSIDLSLSCDFFEYSVVSRIIRMSLFSSLFLSSFVNRALMTNSDISLGQLICREEDVLLTEALVFFQSFWFYCLFIFFGLVIFISSCYQQIKFLFLLIITDMTLQDDITSFSCWYLTDSLPFWSNIYTRYKETAAQFTLMGRQCHNISR